LHSPAPQVTGAIRSPARDRLLENISDDYPRPYCAESEAQLR